MAMLLRLNIQGHQPIRQGSEFFWDTILAKTTGGAPFTFKQIDSACDPYQENSLRKFLRKLLKAGIIEATGEVETYRLLKRASDCPILTPDGDTSVIGKGRQYMWNVMRRSHAGFTVPDLAIAASTEDVVVSRGAAKKYCQHLYRAGILKLQKPGVVGQSHGVYVLGGSANTGPKCPRVMTSTVVVDRNTGRIVGDALAEEERR